MPAALVATRPSQGSRVERRRGELASRAVAPPPFGKVHRGASLLMSAKAASNTAFRADGGCNGVRKPHHSLDPYLAGDCGALCRPVIVPKR